MKPSNDMYVQIELSQPTDSDPPGKRVQVVWVPKETQPKPGMRVTLTGEDQSIWQIERVFQMTLSRRLLERQRDWRVGGIDKITREV